jgi:HEAT repeat protein
MRAIQRSVALVVLALIAARAGGQAQDPPDKPVVDEAKTKELIAALKDPAPAKRKESILAIARLGAAGRAAEPALVDLLRDPDREIRLLAAYALEKLETAK